MDEWVGGRMHAFMQTGQLPVETKPALLVEAHRFAVVRDNMQIDLRVCARAHPNGHGRQADRQI